MQLIFAIIFNALIAIWANHKGYAWWAFVIGSPIVCAIALLILPNLNDSTAGSGIEEKRKQGNTWGLIISGGTIAIEVLKGAML